MESAEVFNQVNHWLSCSWRSVTHGVELQKQLMRVKQKSHDFQTIAEADRLIQCVMSSLYEIRQRCQPITGMPRVAFFPVGVYNPETGETIIAVDTIQYPPNCTDRQCRELQLAEAEWQFNILFFPVDG